MRLVLIGAIFIGTLSIEMYGMYKEQLDKDIICIELKQCTEKTCCGKDGSRKTYGLCGCIHNPHLTPFDVNHIRAGALVVRYYNKDGKLLYITEASKL